MTEKTTIQAAGGLVWNEIDELLMIYRLGKWDLPKGKLDGDETLDACAMREVMEETGIKDLQLGQYLGFTLHEYFDKYLKKEVVKQSHWWEMKAPKEVAFVPQTEEFIDEIQWVNINNIPSYLSNTYKNIEHIVNLYLEKKYSRKN